MLNFPVIGITDYPRPGHPYDGLWREVTVLSYDWDKYVEVECEGKRQSIKAGYVFVRNQRLTSLLLRPASGRVRELLAAKRRSSRGRMLHDGEDGLCREMRQINRLRGCRTQIRRGPRNE